MLLKDLISLAVSSTNSSLEKTAAARRKLAERKESIVEICNVVFLFDFTLCLYKYCPDISVSLCISIIIILAKRLHHNDIITASIEYIYTYILNAPPLSIKLSVILFILYLLVGSESHAQFFYTNMGDDFFNIIIICVVLAQFR